MSVTRSGGGVLHVTSWEVVEMVLLKAMELYRHAPPPQLPCKYRGRADYIVSKNGNVSNGAGCKWREVCAIQERKPGAQTLQTARIWGSPGGKYEDGGIRLAAPCSQVDVCRRHLAACCPQYQVPMMMLQPKISHLHYKLFFDNEVKLWPVLVSEEC
jgi:hypothetical protein